MVESFLEIFLGILGIFAPKMLRNISPSDVVWTGCGRGGPVVEFPRGGYQLR